MSTASEPNPQARRAEALFATGNDAAKQQNFDYAIQMYRDACKLVPENLLYRQALRGVERRKLGNDPAKVSRLVGARLQPSRLRIAGAKAKQRWADVLDACEDVFVHSPWDVGASRDAAEAAEALDLLPVAKWSLESVHMQAGDDMNFLKHLAAVYERAEEWHKAIHMWERVRKISPNDDQARRQINALSATATINRSGLHDAINRPAQGGSGPEAPAPPDPEELKLQALSPMDRLARQIEAEPSRIGNYLDLAELYKRQQKLDEAEKILSRGLKAAPGDESLVQAHAEVQILRLRRAADAWSKRAKEHPDDPDAPAKLKQLKVMLEDYEMKELRRRLAGRPDDLALHLQLGKRLAKAGKHGEAIAAFQQARNSPTLKVEALTLTGQAFEDDGNRKLAERTYLEALKHADPADQGGLNDLNYRLGRVYEAVGNVAKAEEHYNEVAANDYSYLDVAQRIRGLNAK